MLVTCATTLLHCNFSRCVSTSRVCKASFSSVLPDKKLAPNSCQWISEFHIWNKIERRILGHIFAYVNAYQPNELPSIFLSLRCKIWKTSAKRWNHRHVWFPFMDHADFPFFFGFFTAGWDIRTVRRTPRLLTGSTKKELDLMILFTPSCWGWYFFAHSQALANPQNSLKIWSKSSKTDGSKRPWWPHHTWKLLSWEPSWNEVMYLISVSIAPW